MASQPSSHTELGGFPLYIPSQKAVLIGKVDESAPGGHAGWPAYYLEAEGAICVGPYTAASDTFTPRQRLYDAGSGLPQQVLGFTHIEPPVCLSTVGDNLLP